MCSKQKQKILTRIQQIWFDSQNVHFGAYHNSVLIDETSKYDSFIIGPYLSPGYHQALLSFSKVQR